MGANILVYLLEHLRGSQRIPTGRTQGTLPIQLLKDDGWYDDTDT